MLDPRHAEAHYNLGLSYLKLGNKSAAARECEALKKLDVNLANELSIRIQNASSPPSDVPKNPATT
jgi:DNA-binding SARP family transcriptional activator